MLILLFVFNVDFIFSALARFAFVIRSLDTGFPLERNIVLMYTEHGLGREGGKRVKNAFPSFMLSSPSPPFLASLLLFSSHFYSVSVSLCFNATAFLLLLVPSSNCTE